jgi:hypothetical protein
MKQFPVAIGLLVCEQVIVEEDTKNVTPVNCFTRRAVSAFPTDPTNLVVVAFLTDCSGTMSLEVKIESLDNWDVVSRYGQEAKFEDPLREYRCIVRVRNVRFPAPGQYQVTLFADGEPIAQRKVSIQEKQS